MAQVNYLDEDGLSRYDGKIKDYIEEHSNPSKKATYDEDTALYDHAVGDIVYVNDHFYEVTVAITVGDTIAVGTNIKTANLDADTAVYVNKLPGTRIPKQTATIALSSTTAYVSNSTSIVTITMTTDSDGTPTVSSSDSTIATASISGSTITITGLTSGNVTITVSIPATTNYTAVSATISVTSNVEPIPQLVIGNTYFFGGYYWTAAEDLGDNSVCLQSQGMTSGTWPGYKLTTDYTGTKNYGSANTAYNVNIDGDNIANYDNTTQAWYTKYSAVEKTGQAYGSGLFLVSNSKAGQTSSGQQGSGNYWSALKTAATNYSSFGASGGASWLGTVLGSTGAWCVNSGGDVGYNNQGVSYVVAPAFNLDLTKVKLVDGDHIMLPTEEMPTLKTFATATDAEIAAMVEASDNGIIDLYEDAGWRVGQEHQIALSEMDAAGVGESHAAQIATLVLLHQGLYDLKTPTAEGRSKCAFIVGLKNSLAETGYMNDTNTNSGSWKNSKRRAWCNSVFYNAIPSSIRGIFKQFKTLTASVYNGSTNEYTDDYFALAAGKEVFGADGKQGGGSSNQTEGNALTQFTYYATSANRIKKLGDDGSANNWLERSPYYNDASLFCLVSSGGIVSNGSGRGTYGLAPFGCI